MYRTLIARGALAVCLAASGTSVIGPDRRPTPSVGADQPDFVEKDLAAQKTSTPIVVFGHVPLYALYPPWGWTTQDGSQVLAALRRFDAVTVLNGHINQIIQHRRQHPFRDGGREGVSPAGPRHDGQAWTAQGSRQHVAQGVGLSFRRALRGRTRARRRPFACVVKRHRV